MVSTAQWVLHGMAGCVFFFFFTFVTPSSLNIYLNHFYWLFQDSISFIIIIIIIWFTFEMQSIPPSSEWFILGWILPLTKDVFVGEMIWIANSLFDDCFPEAGMIKFSRNFF